jgi:hypothetical protein
MDDPTAAVLPGVAQPDSYLPKMEPSSHLSLE